VSKLVDIETVSGNNSTGFPFGESNQPKIEDPSTEEPIIKKNAQRHFLNNLQEIDTQNKLKANKKKSSIFECKSPFLLSLL
jgi:hypothetical protein